MTTTMKKKAINDSEVKMEGEGGDHNKNKYGEYERFEVEEIYHDITRRSSRVFEAGKSCRIKYSTIQQINN